MTTTLIDHLEGLEGHRAETHDQRPVENEDSGDKVWKTLYDAFVAPFTLAPYSKNRIRSLRGGSYGPDHPLARVDVQPGSVGRDCPCDGHVPRMRTSLGVKVDGADRPGRSCSGCVGVERYGHGVVVIGTATCLILPRSGGTSPEAPRGSHDAEA